MIRRSKPPIDAGPRDRRSWPSRGGTAARVAAAGAAVFAFWLVISGSFALPDMILGLAISLALGAWAVLALWADEAPAVTPRELFALLWYLAGLSRQIFAAAAHLARVVIDPRLPIEPMLITCRTSLRRPISRVAFAQSVTLMPGTLTVDLDGNTFLIHCLGPEFARRIESGEIERRIAAVFEREPVA